MSTPFYDLASLVVVPSGYKSGKVYAQKPLTTDGQLTFTRASTATRVNASGLIEAVATGVPRLDYLNSTCGKLILEGQRTNLFTFSENFDNADWSKTGITITANETTSPDGYVNADKLENSSDGSRYISQNISLTSGTSYTYSSFLKKGIMDWCYLLAIGSTNTAASTFDILNGVVGSSATSNISISNKIEYYGNGWYRCSITFTPTVSTSFNFRIYNADSATDVNTLAGSYNYIYGAQLEASAAYASSYIPTLGASQTRVGDAAFKTGITSLIGQSEGTLFLDFEGGENDSIDYGFSISDETTTNRIVIFRTAANTLQVLVRSSGVTQAIIATGTITPNTRQKCALAYKLNDIAFYVNGVQIGVDTSATIPACSALSTSSGAIAGTLFGRPINQALLFKTRLTNDQLAELTAL